jgi:hypothetical protein
MTDTLRIKRRVSGLAGAPAGLLNAEVAYNEVDNTLYYGQGLGTGLNAANVIPIGGSGYIASYVGTAITTQAGLDATTYAPLTSPTFTGTVTIPAGAAISGYVTTTALNNAGFAPIASPSFTGTPTAPTPASADNSTAVATTAFVTSAISTQATTDAGTYATPADVAAAISADAYVLPTATSSVLGGVEPDGVTITNLSGAISVTYGTVANTAAEGNDPRIVGALSVTTAEATYATISYVTTAISNAGYTLPVATTETLGGVIADGTTIDISGTGIISVDASIATVAYVTSAISSASYNLLPATTSTLGGVMVDGTSIDISPSGVISVDSSIATVSYVTSAIALASYDLLPATTSTLGGVMVDGTSIDISPSGVISVDSSIATVSYVTSAIALASYDLLPATTSTLGGVMVDGTSIDISPSGLISVDSSIATVSYVDATVQGLQVKPTADAATTAPLPANTYANGVNGVGATLTATANGALTVDGVTVVTGDLVLVMNEGAGANNGLYVVTATGNAGSPYILTRQVDMDVAADFAGAFIPVGNEGTVNANTLWLANPGPSVVVGTTVIPFTQLNSATSLSAGTGITVSGDTISIAAGYVGQSSIVTVGTISTGTWQGSTVQVGYGGTGATTLTGYIIGNGTSAMTASASIPSTAITGLGDMSSQFADAVVITGGTIDGVTFDFGSF